METNTCSVNHLDMDAHLPPRKRLLAGLKRQNSDVNFPAPSTPSDAGSENDSSGNNSLRSQLYNPSLSNEEIVEASRIAAIKAAKAAETARAIAEEKVAKAAKAMAAAKSALDLVATLSDEAAYKEKLLKKNKMKKHSGRRTCISSGIPVGEGNQASKAASNGNGVVEVDGEGPVKKMDLIMVDLKTSPLENSGQLKLNNMGRCQPSKTERLKSDNSEVLDSLGKKRGIIKQKKLPLSICSFRDHTQRGAKISMHAAVGQ